MKQLKEFLAFCSVVIFAFCSTTVAFGQINADELLEKARSNAGSYEKLLDALNGPDANMRLSTFDVMINSGDAATRELAIETGLASADPMLQGAALKETIMGLDRLIFSLISDPSQSESIRAHTEKYLQEEGSSFVLRIKNHDPKNSTFSASSTQSGEVNGTVVTFRYSQDSGSLRLQDEVSIAGPIKILHRGNYAYFLGSAQIR